MKNIENQWKYNGNAIKELMNKMEEKDKEAKEKIRGLRLKHEHMKSRILQLSGPMRQEFELEILNLEQDMNALAAE